MMDLLNVVPCGIFSFNDEQSIKAFEKVSPSGLNGFILLLHAGTDAARTDKLYHQLPLLLHSLKEKGYQCVRIDELLKMADKY